MSNGAITDAQIRASSEWDSDHAAVHGRLNFKAFGLPKRSGSWSAGINNRYQWLQIDLCSHYIKVTRVATQGRADTGQWVTMYELQYSTIGVYFLSYRQQGQSGVKVKWKG